MDTTPTSLSCVAVIDLDETLCDTSHRQHYVNVPAGERKQWLSFFDACGEDQVREHVLKIIRIYQEYNIGIGILTGRPRRNEIVTRTWLQKVDVDPVFLFMRPEDCYDKDWQLKAQWSKELSEKYRLISAYDDMDHNLQSMAPYIEGGHVFSPNHDPEYLLAEARRIASTYGLRHSGFSLL